MLQKNSTSFLLVVCIINSDENHVILSHISIYKLFKEKIDIIFNNSI